MLELVSFEDARHQLRLDDPTSEGGPDDGWLAIFIPAISMAVASWLKDSWRLYVPSRDSNGDVILDGEGDPVPEEDSSGDPTVNPIVRAAVLVELAWVYRFREGEGDRTATGDLYSGRYGYTLSRTATSLLNGLRKSTVA